MDISISKNVITADGMDTAMLKMYSSEDANVFVKYGEFKKYVDVSAGSEEVVEIKALQSNLSEVLVVVKGQQPRTIELCSVEVSPAKVAELVERISDMEHIIADLMGGNS